jgi:hypothetical protein
MVTPSSPRSTVTSDESSRICGIDSSTHTTSSSDANHVEVRIAKIDVLLWSEILVRVEPNDKRIRLN